MQNPALPYLVLHPAYESRVKLWQIDLVGSGFLGAGHLTCGGSSSKNRCARRCSRGMLLILNEIRMTLVVLQNLHHHHGLQLASMIARQQNFPKAGC